MPPKNKKQKINQKKKQKTTIAAENQSSDALIKVDSLRKVYKTHHREEGLWNAVKSLFHRVYENKEALKHISKIAQVKHIKDIDARFCVVDSNEIMFMMMHDNEVHPTYDIGIWVNTPYFANAMENLLDISWKNS